MSQFNLSSKNEDIGSLAEAAMSDEVIFQDIMDGLLSKDDNTRSNCFQTVLKISKDHPQFLYPHWDYFQELLSRSNNYSKYIAVYILANLTAFDDDNKFETIFDYYFGLLGGTRAMISSHVALNSAVVACNKPELCADIVDLLLDVDRVHQGKQVELIKSYVIQAMQDIYPVYEDKNRIEEFVKNNLESKSPKTRDAAKNFLKSIE